MTYGANGGQFLTMVYHMIMVCHIWCVALGPQNATILVTEMTMPWLTCAGYAIITMLNAPVPKVPWEGLVFGQGFRNGDRPILILAGKPGTRIDQAKCHHSVTLLWCKGCVW